MAKQVTMTEFFAHMMTFDYHVKDDNDRVNGYSNDCYIDRESGKELGFISFHIEEEEKYYINT